MHRPETTVNLAQFLIEYYTVKLQLEASLVRVGKGSFSRINTSCNNAMELLNVLVIEERTHGHSSARKIPKLE